MGEAVTFAAIQGEYEYRKGIESVVVHERVRVSMFNHIDVRCDAETAEESGRIKGWLEAVEMIYGLNPKEGK